MTYAADTSVSVEKSKAEIEKLLMRYGADQFISGWDREKAHLAFRMGGKMVRLILPLPHRDDPQFQLTPSKRYTRSESEAERAWEQACRSRWRALKLIIQAKLEGIEIGVTTFEREFLSDLLLRDGTTFGEQAIPQIEEHYLTGRMPLALPGHPKG